MACLEKMSLASDCRSERAAEMAIIEMRLGLLKKEDRLLPELYYCKGLTFRQISQLIGEEERKVARRIRQLKDRLLQGEYITIIRNKQNFRPLELEVAYDHFILGMGYRRIAKKYKISEREALRVLKSLNVNGIINSKS